MYEPRLLQEPQRVVYGRVAYRRQKRASLLKHLARGGMMMAFVHDPKHNLPLRSESHRLFFLAFGLDVLSGWH